MADAPVPDAKAWMIKAWRDLNAREQHAIGVEQRLHAPRPFFLEKLPLRLCETEVVM